MVKLHPQDTGVTKAELGSPIQESDALKQISLMHVPRETAKDFFRISTVECSRGNPTVGASQPAIRPALSWSFSLLRLGESAHEAAFENDFLIGARWVDIAHMGIYVRQPFLSSHQNP